MHEPTKSGPCPPRQADTQTPTTTDSPSAPAGAATLKIRGTGRVRQASRILQDYTGATITSAEADTYTVSIPSQAVQFLVEELLTDMGWTIIKAPNLGCTETPDTTT
jgi:hypothetical protein